MRHGACKASMRREASERARECQSHCRKAATRSDNQFGTLLRRRRWTSNCGAARLFARVNTVPQRAGEGLNSQFDEDKRLGDEITPTAQHGLCPRLKVCRACYKNDR